MNISYAWLKDLIEVDLEPSNLAGKLTLAGLELDGMHRSGNDHIFDIEVTSNRGDCLSHLGVAREISALSGNEIKTTGSLQDQPNEENTSIVTIEDSDLCKRFTARIIRGIKVGHSPEWLVKRLEAIGERSINNVADITNYVMHELGQPMHAFDLSKLEGNALVVRRAKEGEKITTLDDIDRELSTSMLMICDKEKPVAVGGVMGGLHSGITAETTDVLLEVAYFDRDSIRKTSRDLNLSSEASYHFERGVDINNLINASNRATELICELAGGTAGDFVDVYPTKFEDIEVDAPDLWKEVKRLSGLDVGAEEISKILSRLGFQKTRESRYSVPSWRHDVTIDEDLVEEIVRIIGYDKIGEELPPALSLGEYQPAEHRKRKLRQTLANSGFDEAISYSFIDERFDDVFEIVPNMLEQSDDKHFVSIKDPIIEGSTRMRPSLLSGLLDAVKTNFNHQNRNIKLFEIGKCFVKLNDRSDLPREQELMGFVITGDETFENRALTSRQLDFYELKGAVETAVAAINSKPLRYVAKVVSHLQQGQSAQLFHGSSPVGFIGRLKNSIASQYKFKHDVFVGELNLQTLLESPEEPRHYSPLAIFPGISRDVSFLTKRNLTFEKIDSEIRIIDEELCKNVEFVDVFSGKGIADDVRSITIRFEYRSDERTLTEDEVEKVHKMILDRLHVNLGITPR